MNPLLEICAGSLNSALAAQEGGAHRVELCDNLREGGTTPSLGQIQIARKLLNITLHVLVRPRGGDFLYSDLEYEIIKEDIVQCKKIGVDGVVVGFLRPDGCVDYQRLVEVVELSRPMSVTFHRAFDMAKDPIEALNVLKASGVDRILTSGQQNSAINGATLIRDLIAKAGDELIIMPGGGITVENINQVMRMTGALEYHATLRNPFDGSMRFRRTGISMSGGSNEDEFSIRETDPMLVKQCVNKLNNK